MLKITIMLAKSFKYLQSTINVQVITPAVVRAVTASSKSNGEVDPVERAAASASIDSKTSMMIILQDCSWSKGD